MLNVQVKYRLPMTSSVELGVAEFRRVLTEAWREVGWFFFEHYVQKHFTLAGGKEYGYRLRSGEQPGISQKEYFRSYTGEKVRKTGQRAPMTFSGRTREGARRATIYPNSRGVRIALPGCVHINQFKPNAQRGGQPPIDLREELLAISTAEAEEVRGQHEASVGRQLGGRRGWADVQMR